MAYRLGFVMEQTLGHVTHAKEFPAVDRQRSGRDPDVDSGVVRRRADRWDNVPVREQQLDVEGQHPGTGAGDGGASFDRLDGLFFHTQVTAIFARGLMADIPTVVSMDATPLNFDRIGSPYDHLPSEFGPLESFKNAMNRRAFNQARRLITWHEWGKDSLVTDYGVDPHKVVVIPPGVDLDKWKSTRERRDRRGRSVCCSSAATFDARAAIRSSRRFAIR